jgi:hypothetical protein
LADLLGPTGQPLPPSNPLVSQKQGDVPVNTQAAQDMTERLKKAFELITRDFGG